MTSKLKLIIPLGSVLLAACAHEREFRVAYVGSEGSVELGGDQGGDSAGAGAMTPPIVAAGNSALGPAGAVLTRGGQRGVVNGSVTSVLPSTNQTLVQLANGATVLLNGSGAALGDLVAIDLGAGRVVGGSTSLIGTNVLNRSASAGQLTAPLTTTPLRTVGNLVNLRSGAGTNAVTSVTAPVRSTTGTVTSILTKPLSGGCC